MVWLGFIASVLFWSLCCSIGLAASLYLYREKLVGERWLLPLPFALAELLFFACRYRLIFWFFSRLSVYEFFAFGSYWEADCWVLVLGLPFYYAVAVLRPQWTVRTRANVSLLVLLPFVLKLALYFSGLVPWDPHPGALMPVRLNV